LYQHDLWYMSLYVGDRVVCRFRWNIRRVNSFSYICLFQFFTCFEQPSAHHQESQLYQYDLWYMSLYVGDRVVCRFGWNIRRVNSFSYICLFQFSTCFEQRSAHHQESQLYQHNLWYMSLYVGDRVVCIAAYHTVTYIVWHIPEVLLIQLTLLMMSTWLLGTCRELE